MILKCGARGPNAHGHQSVQVHVPIAVEVTWGKLHVGAAIEGLGSPLRPALRCVQQDLDWRAGHDQVAPAITIDVDKRDGVVAAARGHIER